MAFNLTLFYAGLLGLILIGLSLQVVRLRRQLGVGIGSGSQPELERAIRAHANFCEYAPLGAVLLLALEASAGAPLVVLHLLGTALVLGRLLHGFFGLNRSAGVSKGRFIGTLLTWLMILASSLLGLWIALGRWLLA